MAPMCAIKMCAQILWEESAGDDSHCLGKWEDFTKDVQSNQVEKDQLEFAGREKGSAGCVKRTERVSHFPVGKGTEASVCTLNLAHRNLCVYLHFHGRVSMSVPDVKHGHYFTILQNVI